MSGEPTVADVQAAFDCFLRALTAELSAMARQVAGGDEALFEDIERLHFGCFVRANDRAAKAITAFASMQTAQAN